MAVTDSGNFSENKGYSLDVFNNAKQTAYNKGYQAGAIAMKAKVVKRINKLSGYGRGDLIGKGQAIQSIKSLPITDKEI